MWDVDYLRPPCWNCCREWCQSKRYDVASAQPAVPSMHSEQIPTQPRARPETQYVPTPVESNQNTTKLNETRIKRKAMRNSVNPAASGKNVDNAMCGCEIDRENCPQLLCMIGLPVIPALALIIFSSLKLDAEVNRYNNLHVSESLQTTVWCSIALFGGMRFSWIIEAGLPVNQGWVFY